LSGILNVFGPFLCLCQYNTGERAGLAGFGDGTLCLIFVLFWREIGVLVSFFQQVVGRGQWVVGSGQWIVGSGQWAAAWLSSVAGKGGGLFLGNDSGT
jgi:hypothetical protein